MSGVMSCVMSGVMSGKSDLARRIAAVLLATIVAAGLGGCAGTAPRPTVGSAPLLAPQTAAQVVFTAMQFLDAPYRRGGTGEAEGADGFDCSGFTRHVYERSLGLVLPRTAWDQARDPALFTIGPTELQPGDLVFFNTLGRAHSHVGIYIGEGRFIHAPRPGTTVRLEDMGGRYWVQRLDGARRAAMRR